MGDEEYVLPVDYRGLVKFIWDLYLDGDIKTAKKCVEEHVIPAPFEGPYDVTPIDYGAVAGDIFLSVNCGDVDGARAILEALVEHETINAYAEGASEERAVSRALNDMCDRDVKAAIYRNWR